MAWKIDRTKIVLFFYLSPQGGHEVAVETILTAADDLYNSTGDTPEMVREARLLAQATSQLVNRSGMPCLFVFHICCLIVFTRERSRKYMLELSFI